jgi:hypothetical protein
MPQARHRAHPYSEREITQVLTCVVAWSGNVQAAVKQLREDEGVAHVPQMQTILGWIRGKHADLYNSIREQSMEQMERDLADRYRGVAAQAIEATELGVQVAVDGLASGKDRDPARSAANLATVADKTLRDYSLLEGKPTVIRENRGLSEAMRALIDMGVLIPHARPEIEASDEGADVEPVDA